MSFCKGLASHQIAFNKGILLFKGYMPMRSDIINPFDFAIGGRHTYLTTYTADLFNQQFKDGHHLTHGQFVDGEMRQFVLKPNAPSLSIESVNEFRTAQKAAHKQRQQFGIARTIDCATLRTGNKIPGFDTFIKDYLLLCTIGGVLADKFPLAAPGRKEVVISRQSIIPCANHIRQSSGLTD